LEPPEKGFTYFFCTLLLQSHLFFYQVGFCLSAFLLFLTMVYLVNLRKSNWPNDDTYESTLIYPQRRFSVSFWFLFSLGLFTFFFVRTFPLPGNFGLFFFLVSLFLILSILLFRQPGKNPVPFVFHALNALAYPIWLVYSRLHQNGNKESKLIDLEQVLENGENEPTVQDQQTFRGIVKFSETEVRQIMTPKSLSVVVDFSWDFSRIIQSVRDNGYSRMPVFDAQKNTFPGILHAKDLIALIDTPGSKWQELIRPPYFVRENDKIIDLLEQFQLRKIHMALVTDDTGNNVGLVTLEDVIEEIVGDITDEFDDEEVTYSKLDALNYIFEAKTPLKDLIRILSLENDFFETDSKTLTINSFLKENKDIQYRKGFQIEYKNLCFTIESFDKRKIRRVKITIIS